MTQSTPLTLGVHHIGLAVPDLAAAVAFFTQALGFREAGGRPDYPSVFVSDGTTLVTLWQADAGARGFDRRANAGLHHLALKVADAAALEQVRARVVAHPGVVAEFDPQPIALGAAMQHFICAMPGGLRIEFATAA